MIQVCSKCGVPKVLETDFYRNGRGRRTQCKECDKEAVYSWRRRNPEKHKARKRKDRYGISEEEIAILALQGCHICGVSLVVASVDHDHVTGQVRGVLCRNCNSGLGFFKDSPTLLMKAIQYLGGIG